MHMANRAPKQSHRVLLTIYTNSRRTRHISSLQNNSYKLVNKFIALHIMGITRHGDVYL